MFASIYSMQGGISSSGVAGDFYATGGNTIAGAGLDIVHTFTASGTFAVVSGSTAVSSLVIAGGGGGGQYGAGGAGGYRSSYGGEASGGGGSAETAIAVGG